MSSSSENLSGLIGLIGGTAELGLGGEGLPEPEWFDRRDIGEGCVTGGVEAVGITTCPEAVTRVDTAGVGGEKRGRHSEGTAESNVGGRGWERAGVGATKEVWLKAGTPPTIGGGYT